MILCFCVVDWSLLAKQTFFECLVATWLGNQLLIVSILYIDILLNDTIVAEICSIWSFGKRYSNIPKKIIIGVINILIFKNLICKLLSTVLFLMKLFQMLIKHAIRLSIPRVIFLLHLQVHAIETNCYFLTHNFWFEWVETHYHVELVGLEWEEKYVRMQTEFEFCGHQNAGIVTSVSLCCIRSHFDAYQFVPLRGIVANIIIKTQHEIVLKGNFEIFN